MVILHTVSVPNALYCYLYYIIHRNSIPVCLINVPITLLILLLLLYIGFTWASLLPVLVTKAAELMHIPASAGVEGVAAVQNAHYPHTFHGHYVRMLIAPKHGNADVRATALKKLAKLYYFVTSTVSYTTTTSSTTAGRELVLVPSLPLSITPPESTVTAINTALIPCNGVSGDILYVLPGAVDAMQLFQVHNILCILYIYMLYIYTVFFLSYYFSYIIIVFTYIFLSLQCGQLVCTIE